MVVLPCAPFVFLLTVSLHLAARVGFAGSPAIQVAVLRVPGLPPLPRRSAARSSCASAASQPATASQRLPGRARQEVRRRGGDAGAPVLRQELPFREPHHRESEVPVILSSKQALFILAVFRQYYQESLNAGCNRTGFDNPWFVFGVSYAGALSAWFRLKFPHLTWGSLASSGVVLAVYNFTDFDRQVGELAGPECKSALQETTKLVEEQLQSDSRSVKALFGDQSLKDDDFLLFLADVAAITFQYGNPDAVCSPLINAKKNGKTWWHL